MCIIMSQRYLPQSLRYTNKFFPPMKIQAVNQLRRRVKKLDKYIPKGPAKRTAQRGFKGCTIEAIALAQRGAFHFGGSLGFSGNPHGSARIRCFTLKKKNMTK